MPPEMARRPPPLCDDALEGRERRGVDPVGCHGAQLFEGGLRGCGGPVASCFGDRDEDVRDFESAREKRDLRAAKASGIAAAVRALVVRENGLGEILVAAHRAHEVRGDARMVADLARCSSESC